jgi:chaperonin cofactor prefoldin
MTIRLKKWWLVSVVVLAVPTVSVGTIWSYVRTVQTEIGKQVRDAVPIGFELKRLEQMTADLIPEMQANRKVAAQLDVEIEYLEREVAEMGQSQRDAKAEMEKLREALRKKQDRYEFGGQSFTRRQVEDDLSRRLTRYEDTRVRQEAKQRILDARRKTLDAATDKIRACQQQHDLLVEKAESLQAELKLLELAQASGNFQFDHSKLQQTKDLAVSVEKRIRTLHKLVDGEQQLADGIPVEADERSATEKFDEYFSKADAGVAARVGGK